MTQADLFANAGITLPDEKELRRRFREFNDQFFNGKLPRARVEWSNRMRIAGSCNLTDRVIKLSRVYHEHFPDDVDDTLKHEMIHLVNQKHDEAFRREAERVGATVHCRDYPGLHPKARYVYICPSCQTVFHRARRERLCCGRCARYRFDPRFELVLRPPLNRAIPRRPTSARVGSGRPRSRKSDLSSGDLFGHGKARSRAGRET